MEWRPTAPSFRRKPESTCKRGVCGLMDPGFRRDDKTGRMEHLTHPSRRFFGPPPDEAPVLPGYGWVQGRKPSKMIWFAQKPLRRAVRSSFTVQVKSGMPSAQRMKRGAKAGRRLCS